MSSFCDWTREERLTVIEWLKRLASAMLDEQRTAGDRFTAAFYFNALSQAIADDTVDLPEWAKVAPNPRIDTLQQLLRQVQR